MSDGDITTLGGETIKSQTLSRYDLLRDLADSYDKLATLEGLPEADDLWNRVRQAQFLLGEDTK